MNFPPLIMILRAAASFMAGDDGDGGGELDGAGIIHHQHGKALEIFLVNRNSAPAVSRGIGNDRIRQLFRPALDARFQFLRMVDQGDDIVNAGLVSCGVHPDDEGTRFQRGSGKDDGPFPFGSRFRFPVMAAWLTSASPDSTVPSTGMTFPASTRIFLPGRICSMGTWRMPPSSTRQTRSIFMLRLAASAARVFSECNFSSGSEMERRNMMELAVP